MQPAGSGVTLEVAVKLGIPASATAVLTALGDTGSQSEDCLTLNVWTKPQTGDAKKAVLVWVHGGAFTTGKHATVRSCASLCGRLTRVPTGSSRIPAYSGKFIADQTDVVVVSLK